MKTVTLGEMWRKEREKKEQEAEGVDNVSHRYKDRDKQIVREDGGETRRGREKGEKIR